VTGLGESLGRVLEVPGVRAAALVDVGTGMIVSSAGDGGAAFPDAAAAEAASTRSLLRGSGPASPGGDLDEVAVLTPARFLLTKILDARPGEGLLLLVDLDRDRTNLALAAWQVGQAAPDLLA
jgi:hypothetical protein